MHTIVVFPNASASQSWRLIMSPHPSILFLACAGDGFAKLRDLLAYGLLEPFLV